METTYSKSTQYNGLTLFGFPFCYLVNCNSFKIYSIYSYIYTYIQIPSHYNSNECLGWVSGRQSLRHTTVHGEWDYRTTPSHPFPPSFRLSFPSCLPLSLNEVIGLQKGSVVITSPLPYNGEEEGDFISEGKKGRVRDGRQGSCGAHCRCLHVYRRENRRAS